MHLLWRRIWNAWTDGPFNRGAFFENDKETYQEVLRLTSLRNREKVLQTGYALYMAPTENVLAILRFISEKKDVFGEASENKAILLLVNPTNEKRRDQSRSQQGQRRGQ